MIRASHGRGRARYARHARRIGEGVLAAARDGIGEDSDAALHAAVTVATVALDEAEKTFLHLLEVERKKAGTDDDIGVMETLNHLGQTYSAQERYEDAERVTADVLARARRVLGNEHSETLYYVNNLAIAKRRLGKMDEAGALYKEGYEVTRRLFGAAAPQNLISMVNLSSFYAKSGRCKEEAAFIDAAVEVCRKSRLPDTPNLGLALRSYGQCREAAGQFAEAEKAYFEADQQLASVLRPDDPMLLVVHGVLAHLYETQGRAADAALWKAKAEPKPAPGSH